MRKLRYFVIVQWVDVFGNEHETEIPCTDSKHQQKLLKQTACSFKHDPIVANFKVAILNRKG